MQKSITLTQANDENFDAAKLGMHLDKLSDSQIYNVIKVTERICDGNLNYVTLLIEHTDIANPNSDLLIIDTINKECDGETTSQIRVLWDSKLWRILDDEASLLLELMYGITKKQVAEFTSRVILNEYTKLPLANLNDWVQL